MNSHSPYKHNKNNHRDISEGKQHHGFHGFKWRFLLVSHLVNMLEDLVTGVETSSLTRTMTCGVPNSRGPYLGARAIGIRGLYKALFHGH